MSLPVRLAAQGLLAQRRSSLPPIEPSIYTKISLRGDNVGSSVVIDEVNGSSAWTLTGATQTSTGAIAGAGAFNFVGNANRSKRIETTDLAIRTALAYSSSSNWVLRFKFRVSSYTDYYNCILGSGPGNPVLTFTNNGQSFNTWAGSWDFPSGAPSLNDPHEIELCRFEGVCYFFFDGVLMATFNDTSSQSVQDLWFIGCQTHPEFQANENFDGYIDDFQWLVGIGGHTTNYTPAFSTPFPA